MTDTNALSECDKTILNADESIYSDLITEIELDNNDDDNNDGGDKQKESPPPLTTTTDLEIIVVEEQNTVVDELLESTDIPTESETYVSAVLTPDDAVSDFFAKTDEFESDMLELDEGINFKNETSVIECHREFESKKLFDECDDIADVVNEPDAPENVPDAAEEVVPELVTKEEETKIIETGNAEETGFEAEEVLIVPADESLNRMHVMEDVEEGCDVSGALPSSPGHAEQRPDPPKQSPDAITSVETPTEPIPPAEETTTTTTPPPQKSPEHPIENGITSEETPAVETAATTEEIPEKTSSPIPEETTIPPPPAKEEKDEKVVEEEIKKEIEKETEEDSASSDSSRESSNSTKRKYTEDEQTTCPAKKLRTQIQQEFINHDRILSDYIDSTNCSNIEQLQSQTVELLAEIRTLNDLAREKEREWNSILHVKKVKEELLIRMQRKKQILQINSGEKQEDWDEQDVDKKHGGGNGMMVPVVSSSPARTTTTRHDKSKTRTIMPKTKDVLVDLNGQEGRQGRQGPILDVRSIIADYRQRHPETVPRRGRRLKSVLNTSNSDKSNNILSMASLAFGAGAQVRHGNASDMTNELGMILSAMDSARQDGSRPSSADSSVTSGANDSMSFKDVLVQFARLSQSERQELQAQAAASLAAQITTKPPPPPYPEVTLHPVPPVTAQPAVPATQNNSLLHGILTKTQQPRVESKPTTFSPTLARLLTAPERVSNNAQAMYTAALNSGVSISDLLSSGKSRNEITITPVNQFVPNTKQNINKDGQHIEEEETEDSADRLVIDEGTEGANNRTADNGSEQGDEVPQCQGCHQKPAQFVCAGCGNQWYCSRDCQVAAWDEHSEVCSG